MAAANEVTLQELHDHEAEILARVEGGERLTITAHGKPIGELVPPIKGASRDVVLARIAWAKENPVDDRFGEDIKALRDEHLDETELRFRRWGWA